jgi:GT2 family glycosyltransferase
MKRIVVVLINYYKEEKLAAFVMELLLPQKGVDLRIIVVDNGSSLKDPLKTASATWSSGALSRKKSWLFRSCPIGVGNRISTTRSA